MLQTYDVGNIHWHMRFLFPAVCLLLAADKEGGAGSAAPAKPLSLDAQLTAATTRIAEFETQAAGWEAERQTLTSERDAAVTRADSAESSRATVIIERDTLLTRATSAEGQITTLNGQITALTAERDAAVALSKDPSAQAQTILAAAGAPPVASRTEAGNPAVTKPDVSGLSGLEKAIALNQSAKK